MKRGVKVFCIVAALLLALLAGLVIWQWDNLGAVKMAVQLTPEELEDKLAENQQLIRDAVESAPEVVVRDITEEERQALRDGILTPEELMDRLMNHMPTTTPEPTPSPVVTPEPTKSPDPVNEPNMSSEPTTAPDESGEEISPGESGGADPSVPPESEYQKQISAVVARVYVLREEYMIELDNMFASAKAEYLALPEEERTKANLAQMASRYLSAATELERECDRRMDNIVVEMERIIRENNGDLGLLDTVVYAYANEKSLKKAFYMSELEKKGLVL